MNEMLPDVRLGPEATVNTCPLRGLEKLVYQDLMVYEMYVGIYI